MPTLFKLPELHCPACNEAIVAHSPITEQGKAGAKKGTIFVCAQCGTFLILGDSHLQRMTVKQFKNLPEDTQKLLGITRYRLEEFRARN